MSSTSQANSSKGRRKVLVEITPQAPVKIPKDDLTNIEGIGPAIAKVLKKAGILNYAQLAKTSVSKIQKIMDSGGPRFRMHDPGSWPKQADLLAKGKLKEFKVLTDRLKGGR
ncbi:MAG: helix-hairpin-helix domain-containing protein [Saprospiraceae bacterium]